jgi:hypothetical protein
MDQELRREIGKFFVDIAKLLIGGAVLSSVLKIHGLSSIWVISLGSILALFLAVLGFYILSIKDKT